MADKVFKSPLELAQEIQTYKRPDLKGLEDKYKKYLDSYKTDISKIGYSDENGYPQKDAIFDQILIRDFNRHAKDNGYGDDWDNFNALVNIDDDEATGLWNRIGDLTTANVNQLLGGK